jgi:5S rRNA maturation endonuclease (ribonuclease M5)
MTVNTNSSKGNNNTKQQQAHEAIAKIRGYSSAGLVGYSDGIQVFSQEHQRELNYIPVGANLVGKFIIPVYTPVGEFMTWIVYDPLAKLNQGPKYSYFSETVKSRLVFAPLASWELILTSDQLYLTDGVWDSIHANYRGFPTVSLLGSTLSKEHLKILRRFKRVILFQDNDKAGALLYQNLRKFLGKQVFTITLPQNFGDIDQYLAHADENTITQLKQVSHTKHLGQQMSERSSNS